MALSTEDVRKSYDLRIFRKKEKINRLGQKGSRGFTYFFLVVFVILAVYPFVWAVFQSFNDSDLITTSGVSPFPHAGNWTTANYDLLFNSPATKKYIGSWISNSILYSFIVAILNTFFNFLGGYALARIAFKGKNQLMFYFMASIIIPMQATMIPTYAIYQWVGLFSRKIPHSLWFFALVFKGMANIVLTLQIRQFYLSQKADIEEAARTEGLSRFKAFIKISIRQMLPLFAIQFTMVFIVGWNDFLTFRLFSLGSLDKFNITTGILNLASSATSSNGIGVALSLSVITFIPMFVIYGFTLKIQAKGMQGGYK